MTKPELTSLQVARIRAKSTRPRSGRGTREACASFVWLAPEGANHPKVSSPYRIRLYRQDQTIREMSRRLMEVIGRE